MLTFSRKSQIALEHVYRHKSPDAAVFWVHASSAPRFVDSYKRIASECRIPGRDDPNSDTLQLVQNWLETKCPFRWTMIVDNLDDRVGFLERSEDSETNKALCEYVPQTAQGAILYSTRSRDIGIDLSPGKDPIMVQCLQFDEAQALLGESLVRDTPEDDQFALFESLDYLPLAIAQAAAFMTKRRKRVSEYLNLIQDDSTRSQIMSQKNYIHDRAERSSESIVSTWWVTFRSIKRENARAAELLAMMSLLDRHEIPVSIMQEADEGIFDFEAAIALLEDFSLITTSSGVSSCYEHAFELLNQKTYDTSKSLVFGEMHRLVQESTKAWLIRPDGNAADIATNTLQHIGRCFKVVPESIQLCTLLYPHLNASLCYISENFEASQERFDDRPDDLGCRIVMLHELSRFLMLQGKFRQSEPHIRLAVSICKTYLGVHHRYTLKSMELYGFVCCSSGRFEEAYAIQNQIVLVSKKMFGPWHPETLKAVDQLGEHFATVGNLGEAERILCCSLFEKRENLLESPEDKQSRCDLVDTMACLASVFVNQGEHQRALDLLKEALELVESLPKKDQYRSWSIKVDLAQCLCQCGKYQDAHSLIEPALERERRFFGNTHHCTLYLRRDLVILIWAEGRYDEAEELMNGVFEDWADSDDADSPGRISVLCSIGEMQYSRGKFKEAEITFKKSLQMVVDRGQEWFSTSTYSADDIQQNIQRDIRQCLEFQGESEEAKTDIVPSKQTPTLDTEKPSEVDESWQKDKTLFTGSHFEKSMAPSMAEPVVPIKSSRLDETQTEQTMAELAYSLLRQQKYEEADQLGRENLARTKRTYGWDNIKTQAWVLFLAQTTRRLGQLDESEDHWCQLLHWQNYQFRQKDYYFVVKANNAIAKLMTRRGDSDKAEQSCRRVLAIHPAYLKSLPPKLVANTMAMLGTNLLL